jgi:hypothetical protein
MSNESLPPPRFWKFFLSGAFLGIVIGAVGGFAFGYDTATQKYDVALSAVRNAASACTGSLRQEAIDRGFAELVLVPDEKGGGNIEFRWKGENKRLPVQPAIEAPKKLDAPPPPEKIIDLPDKSRAVRMTKKTVPRA